MARRFGTMSDCKLCHVLIISPSEAARLAAVLTRVEGSPVLTVGDTDGFARKGVILSFFLERDRVRFEINPDAARRHGLKISSKVLRLARIIGDEKDE